MLHTLVVDPAWEHRGRARALVAFYEDLARALYARLGYSEAGIVPTTFNGIPGVQLVCLEKVL